MHCSVFAYGTLSFPEIAAQVTGERPAWEAARLHDHARHALKRCAFPGAVPRPGGSVEGVVYHGMSPRALERIDAFEGELYRRAGVTVVTTAQQRPVRAHVYLLRPRWRTLLLPHDWCPDAFRRDCHAGYLRRLGAAGTAPAGG